MSKKKLGFCMCGSFCTFKENIEAMKNLSEEYDILPIMSYNAYSIDTRFGKASEHIAKIEEICQNKIIATIAGAEPIGPKKMVDILLVSPCTGNTLAKLASSITDTPVTMAVKSHLRNGLPVVLAVSTNDALSGCAKNIGKLLNMKNYFFVPFRQDNFEGKPNSLVADFSRIGEALRTAATGKQCEPLLIQF